jgi:phage shock protein A
MELNRIKEQFGKVEQSISRATQVCQEAKSAPQELKDCVRQMSAQSQQARQMVQGNDEQAIRRCIDELEESADRAKAACQKSGNLDPQLKDAVMQAHQQASSLKRQVH